MAYKNSVNGYNHWQRRLNTDTKPYGTRLAYIGQLDRQQIGQKLTLAGWIIKDKARLILYESVGIAVREMDATNGPADYMLFINGQACGIIEAKKEGTGLGGVAEQS